MLSKLLRNESRNAARAHACFPHSAVEPLESRRLLSAGDFDLSFSGDGKVLAEDARVARSGNDAVVQPDGKVVVLGHRGPGGFALSSAADVELTRYNADGSLDTTFGSGGRVQTGLGGHDTGVDVQIDAQGRLVVAASSLTTDGRVNRWALLRYLPTGAPDASFGTGGRTVLDLGDTVGVSGMALAPDGKIVVSGGTAASRFTVARFTASGDLDATFSGDGLVTTDFGTDQGAGAQDVAVMSDGRVVAMGNAASATSDPTTSSHDVVLARYNTNGSLDTTFDGDGKATAPDTGVWEIGRAVALYPDGRVVVAGDADGRFRAWRLTAAGRPDATFGTAGVASHPLLPD
ncbi:MAG TPA: hypothetical protein VFB66_15425, partial [Tepidisphaeraceae bacterium]|nr:hypothetical protein [Tepidisphaeraceae bacterium]